MTSYFLLLYNWFLEEIWAIPGRVLAFFFFMFLFTIPLMLRNPYVLQVLILCHIFCIFAVSWDVLAGFAGQLNLGHGLFFGIGNYTVALLNLHFGLPSWVTIPLGGIASVLGGLIACLPALRLRGFYLALVTLSFPIILAGIILRFWDFTGGEMGLYGIDPLSNSRVVNYYITLLTMGVSIYIMYKLTDSGSKSVRVGVILRAIREDEISARTSGIDTTKYKLVAFSISAFFAGIAGGFYGVCMRVANPSVLELSFSFQVILWTIFGSITTIYGAVAGVFFLYPITEFLRLNIWGDYIRFILIALILIITLLYMPEGITVWVRDKIEEQCPRCKLKNMVTRSYCRACRAPLRLERTPFPHGKKEGEL